MNKDELLKELQRIMPRARWHHVWRGDTVFCYRAIMDPASPLSCVSSRVDLHVGVGAKQSRLEMPIVGLEYINTLDNVTEFADSVRHTLMFGFAWWLAETAKRGREALCGYRKPTDPINPFDNSQLDPPEGHPSR